MLDLSGVSAGDPAGARVVASDLVKSYRVIQTQLQHRRRMAPVLGRSHHDNDVRLASFIAHALAPDSHREGDEITESKGDKSRRQKCSAAFEVRYSYLNIVGDASAQDAEGSTSYECRQSAGQKRSACHCARRPYR